MSLGKSGGTTFQTPELSPEQRQAIQAQTGLLTNTIIPTYTQAVGSARDLYNASAGGVNRAAQNLAATAGQAGTTFGQTGETALRTGVGGLQSLFGRDYERQQLQAALSPAQAQFQQNLAGLQSNFGGMGMLGSARQALAERQLAGQTQAAQQQAAAKVLSDISAQRAAAASNLASIGAGGLSQALGAAQQGISAAMTPQQLYNQYASVIFGTPSSAYRPDFSGTQGFTQTTDRFGFQVSPFKTGGV